MKIMKKIFRFSNFYKIHAAASDKFYEEFYYHNITSFIFGFIISILFTYWLIFSFLEGNYFIASFNILLSLLLPVLWTLSTANLALTCHLRWGGAGKSFDPETSALVALFDWSGPAFRAKAYFLIIFLNLLTTINLL